MNMFAAIASALLALPPQSSQSPGSNDQIIVNGPRERAEIAKFVDQLATAQADIQLGKFLQPICPAVVGLPDGQNELVAARMRKVAETIGAPAGAPGCIPNAIVMVVRDKRAAIDDLWHRRSWLFGEIPAADMHLLKALPGPAAGWQVIGKIGADMMPINRTRFGGVRDMEARETPLVKSYGVIGRIQQASVPQFLASVLLVEDRALDGVTTTQFADYAAMRVLAPISWRDRPLPARSILNLLNAVSSREAAPLSVTWWDVALLKALYDTSNSVPADIQRSAIAAAMQREIRKVPPEER